MLIEKVKSPNDIKQMSIKELEIISEEIRKLLIKKCSKKGGHIGPNLGVVELTIALHYVFDSPKDKIIFDVSHQSYVHKILTGRADAFIDENRYDEVSGFTNPDENESDIFKLGHTSSSISIACGLAKIRDLRDEKNNIIVMIGDGALGGGQAFEGLDFGGSEIHSNLIVIINDNEMSIAENHGSLYEHLHILRRNKGVVDNNIFEALGYRYFFIDSGNDVATCIGVLSEVKDIASPAIVHVVTEKGHGYRPAVLNKEMWHYRPPFNPGNGEMLQARNRENYDDMTCDFMIEKMKSDKNVVMIVAGIPLTAGFTPDKRMEAGNQFIDVGIAEQGAISLAAGIAKGGGKPVFCTDATFFQRAYDQISQEVCINKNPVTMLVRNASIYGQSDVTHLGFFDIPLLSNIPNLIYFAPITKKEYFEMLAWSIEQTEYPVAIRIPKKDVPDDTLNEHFAFSYNKNVIVSHGRKIAIMAVGSFFHIGLELEREIEREYGFWPTLIHPRYISGIDKELLENLAQNHSIIIIIEDGVLDGGYGEKIARFYGGCTVKTVCYGLKKEFIDRYRVENVLEENHLTPKLIIQDIREMVNK